MIKFKYDNLILLPADDGLASPNPSRYSQPNRKFAFTFKRYTEKFLSFLEK